MKDMTPTAPQTDQVFTVTQLCREFEVTPRALRFYESKGLLHPAREGMRRRFDHRDKARLSLILRGKRFGFSLAEIGELLDLYETDNTQVSQLTRTLEVAERRMDDMRRQRDELTIAIEELQTQMDFVGGLLNNKKSD